jgi:hypothetical protein
MQISSEPNANFIDISSEPTVWRRERVGRTSTAVEVGTKKERRRGMDLAAVREAIDAVSRRM